MVLQWTWDGFGGGAAAGANGLVLLQPIETNTLGLLIKYKCVGLWLQLAFIYSPEGSWFSETWSWVLALPRLGDTYHVDIATNPLGCKAKVTIRRPYISWGDPEYWFLQAATGQVHWHPRRPHHQNRLTFTTGPLVRQLIVTICYSRCASDKSVLTVKT